MRDSRCPVLHLTDGTEIYTADESSLFCSSQYTELSVKMQTSTAKLSISTSCSVCLFI